MLIGFILELLTNNTDDRSSILGLELLRMTFRQLGFLSDSVSIRVKCFQNWKMVLYFKHA